MQSLWAKVIETVTSTLLGTGVLVALVQMYLKRREPYAELAAKRLDDNLRERARVSVEYLRPLQEAAHELALRLCWYLEALSDGASEEAKDRINHLRKSVAKAKDQLDRSDRTGYLLFCNGEGVDGADALYAFTHYFAAVYRARRALPYIQVVLGGTVDLHRLQDAINEVEKGLNKDGLGVYETVQRSMGQYMLDGDRIKPYPVFCELLCDKATWAHFLGVLDFVLTLEAKRDHQLKAACEGLQRVLEALNPLCRLLPEGRPS
jgi:hypothetical protein